MPLLEKLTQLDEEKRKIEAERKILLHRRATWQAKQDLLLALEFDQAQELAESKLDCDLTRDEKRNRLRAVELEVLVYRADDPEHDRFEIQASIPLRGAIGATSVAIARQSAQAPVYADGLLLRRLRCRLLWRRIVPLDDACGQCPRPEVRGEASSTWHET